MSELIFPTLPYSGIQVVQSDDVPVGYKRTEGDTIYINPKNYAFLRQLKPKVMIIGLAFLGEIANE